MQKERKKIIEELLTSYERDKFSSSLSLSEGKEREGRSKDGLRTREKEVLWTISPLGGSKASIFVRYPNKITDCKNVIKLSND